MARSSAGWYHTCQLNQARSNRRNCCATSPAVTRASNSRIKTAGLGRASRRIGAGSEKKLANRYQGHLNLNLNAPDCLANAVYKENSDVIRQLFLLFKAIEQVWLTDHV